MCVGLCWLWFWLGLALVWFGLALVWRGLALVWHWFGFDCFHVSGYMFEHFLKCVRHVSDILRICVGKFSDNSSDTFRMFWFGHVWDTFPDMCWTCLGMFWGPSGTIRDRLGMILRFCWEKIEPHTIPLTHTKITVPICIHPKLTFLAIQLFQTPQLINKRKMLAIHKRLVRFLWAVIHILHAAKKRCIVWLVQQILSPCPELPHARTEHVQTRRAFLECKRRVHKHMRLRPCRRPQKSMKV